MEDHNILVDDTKTTAKVWEGWHITGYNSIGLRTAPYEDSATESAFTKQDFEKAPKKVSRKVKKQLFEQELS